MGEFGWAYISGSNLSAAQGIDGSVQLKKAGDTSLSGSSALVFDTNDNLKITGSVLVNGNVSASAEISASAYYGDGSNLSGIGSGLSISSDGANRVLTSDGDNTLTAESNLTFDGTTMVLTGTLNVSGTVNANAYNVNVTNRSVINLTATGSTIFGDTSDDVHQFTGSVFLNGELSSSANLSASAFYGDGSNLTNVSSPLIIKEEGSNITTSAASINFVGAFITASTSGDDVTVTVNAGGGSSTIGAAEDGDYTDGLYTDFTTGTAIGTAVDRFNEVLKILAPSPAPAVSTITSSVSNGITAKLSFGSSKTVADYTSSATTAGFPAVDATGIYSSSTLGSNYRLGIYDGTQDITGEINHHVVESVTNGYLAYSNDAFGNANEGTLKLELNGTVIHSVALSGLAGTGNPNTGSANSLTSQSGFTNVSVTASSFDGNNSEWYIFKHRTAKFKVDTDQQKVGWNYLRVIHSLSTDNNTNYIEWINDPSGAVNDLSVTNARIENIALVGSKFLSGVEYNTDATANYKADINNLYRNIYAASGNPISFTATNSSNPSSQAVPDLGGSDDNTKVLGVTGALDFNGSTLFNGAITCNTTVTHPLKNTITNQGSATTGNGFLIDNRTLASTNLEEKFHDETYRKTSGSYDTQGSTIAASAVWNSQNHMTGGGASGHTDGLLYHNQRLYSPVDGDIPNGGNFGGMSNVETGQPNYSSIVGTRTFYRIITNSSGVTKRDMKIVSTKNSTRYNDSTLGASNIHFFAKIPGSTGWMDISQPFNYGSSSDGHGALIHGATSNSNTASTDSGNSTHCISFGTQSVTNGGYVMIKALADESWAGYLTELSFSVGATSNTATESLALDDIDLDDTAGVDAKLSFGASNGVVGYSNAQGSGIGSMANYDSNALYSDQGTTKRGVFKAFENMGGTLNENVSANGTNYPADSFKDSYRGALSIEVNGSEKHEVILYDTIGAKTNDFNGNNSGFSVSALSFSTTTDGIPDYTKPYRTGTYQIGTSDQRLGWNYARVVHDLDRVAMQTIVVTVVGGIFYFDGVKDTTLSLKIGNTYRFDTSDSSNGSHPLAFSTTSDGSHGGGSAYTTGVTSGAGYIQIIPEAAVTLYPYCTSHPNMGGTTQLNITATTKVQTNYVEWIVDTTGSTDNTAVSAPSISDFGHTTLYYQSGIRYFVPNPTASFDFSGSNFYSNVYSNDSAAISFPTTTNCSVTNIRAVGSGITTFDSAVSQAGMPNLNNSTDCEITTIQITGTVQYDGSTPSISGGLGLFTANDVSVTGRILHPFKSDKTTSVGSKTALMVYSGSIGSTTIETEEHFNTETYRIVSGNYANQTDTTSSANAWNPQTQMNGGGSHDDGMVTAAGFAISPFQIGVAGNTGHASLQAPAGNPDYSSLTNNVRTFYRYFKYTSASTVASFSMNIKGDANLVAKTGTYAAALGANKNVFIELKVPYDANYSGADDQSTGWADCAKIFDASAQPTTSNDGAGIRSGETTGEDQTIDSPSGLDLSLTLGARRIKQNQYVVVKVSAHKDWTGYLSQITIAYS